jgi:hypothetical protein
VDARAGQLQPGAARPWGVSQPVREHSVRTLLNSSGFFSPAGGSFNVEMAENKVCTTMSSIVPVDQLGNFGNCRSYDINTYGNFANGSCITMPNLHTRNKTDAAGSAFAISYTNDITRVNEQNLVVFTVAPNTPFERAASFQVPAAMPPCPPGGCICAWGWVPNGCGAPNMYMLPYRCQVTGWNKARAKTLAAPKPPAYCQGNSTACVKGAKQMVSSSDLSQLRCGLTYLSCTSTTTTATTLCFPIGQARNSRPGTT